jgi:thiosulfate dehydrogenase
MRRFFFALALAACTRPDDRIVRGTAVDHGEALFSDAKASPATVNFVSCATCHRRDPAERPGLILTGGLLRGATTRPLYWGGHDNDLLTSINHCRYFFMSARDDWTPKDEEARAMYGYLTSLDAKAAESEKQAQPYLVQSAVTDLPAGDGTRGKDLYDRACRSCHGAASTGAGRPSERAPLLPQDTVAAHEYLGSPVETRKVFIEKVRHGGFLGYGGTMPPFTQALLPDADLAAILAYLKLY